MYSLLSLLFYRLVLGVVFVDAVVAAPVSIEFPIGQMMNDGIHRLFLTQNIVEDGPTSASFSL